MFTQFRTSTLVDGQRVTRRIVVGVDPRGRSTSALVWAVEEAERAGTLLTLVSARRQPAGRDVPAAAHDAGSLARRLTLTDVETRQVLGDPVEALLRAAADADLLTLGCRSMHPTRRMLLGSTSQAVARWSPVPVVVVPEAWLQPQLATAPIVAGVRPVESGLPPAPRDAARDRDPDREVLDFAFARAATLRVPVTVVSGWTVPGVYAWSPEAVERLGARHQRHLEARLAPWRRSHPDVEVQALSRPQQPDQAILDAARSAQLIVVGRHHSATLSGLLGSTAHRLLQHTTRPVAIVPAGSRVQLLDDLETRRVLTQRLWAPTY